VRHYPQPKYWEDLLNEQLFRTKDDRALRGLYRLMSDTNTLDKGDEYSEMGSMLIAGGFPNEAKQVLERGWRQTSSSRPEGTRAGRPGPRPFAAATDAKTCRMLRPAGRGQDWNHIVASASCTSVRVSTTRR